MQPVVPASGYPLPWSLVVPRIDDPFARPYRIEDTVPPADRERALQRMAAIGAQHPLLQRVVQLLLPATMTDPRQRATTLLSYVQRDVGYLPDPAGEWWQGVLYTLGWGGDCEDLASLLVAMMLFAGLDARVHWMEQEGAPLNHVTVLVRIGNDWLYADPSVMGARLGEPPAVAATRLNQRKRVGLE